MRKLIVLLATAGLLLGFTGSAQAGEFVPGNSTLGLVIGGLPQVSIDALPGTEALVTLGDQIAAPFGHVIGVSSTIWSTVNFGPGTSLFTGVPLISNLKFTVNNKAGVLQDGFTVASNQIGGGGVLGPSVGGVLRLRGDSVISAGAGAVIVPVPLDHVGGLMGETTGAVVLGVNITATNGPFMSATITITGLTSNIITIPQRGNAQGLAFTLNLTPSETGMSPSTNGGYVSVSGGQPFTLNTVTISGTNNLLSGSKAGAVTVVSPLRIATHAIAGTIPGRAVIHLEYVPEPGTMLLLVSGAVGLAVIGRRRMRK